MITCLLGALAVVVALDTLSWSKMTLLGIVYLATFWFINRPLQAITA